MDGLSGMTFLFSSFKNRSPVKVGSSAQVALSLSPIVLAISATNLSTIRGSLWPLKNYTGTDAKSSGFSLTSTPTRSLTMSDVLGRLDLATPLPCFSDCNVLCRVALIHVDFSHPIVFFFFFLRLTSTSSRSSRISLTSPILRPHPHISLTKKKKKRKRNRKNRTDSLDFVPLLFQITAIRRRFSLNNTFALIFSHFCWQLRRDTLPK